MYLFRSTFISFHKAKRTFKKNVVLEAGRGLTKSEMGGGGVVVVRTAMINKHG